MIKQTSCLQQLVYYQYLQYLGQQKLSKQHIKQIISYKLHFPSSKKRKFYEIKLSFATMNNYIQNNIVKSNQNNKEQ